jgi:hypothetical protein
MGVLWLWTGPRAVFVALGVGAGVCVYVGESGSCGMWESRVHVGCGRVGLCGMWEIVIENRAEAVMVLVCREVVCSWVGERKLGVCLYFW